MRWSSIQSHVLLRTANRRAGVLIVIGRKDTKELIACAHIQRQCTACNIRRDGTTESPANAASRVRGYTILEHVPLQIAFKLASSIIAFENCSIPDRDFA